MKDVIELQLEEITIDPEVQDREEMGREVIADYAASDLSKFPPVRVWDDGQIKLLSAGHHTLEAHKLAGLKTIRATVFQGTKADAILDAVRSNTRHGKQRTGADKRRAVTRLVETFPDWSDNKIALEAQVSDNLVENVRAKISSPQISNQPSAGSTNGTCAGGGESSGGQKLKGKDNKKYLPSKEEIAKQQEWICRLVAADPDRSSRDIAGEVACSPRTVDKLKKLMAKEEKQPKPEPEVSESLKVCPSCARKIRLRQEAPKKCPECRELNKPANGQPHTNGHAEQPKAPTDAKGHTIPDSCAEAFRSIDNFSILDSLCRQLQAGIDELSHLPGGEQLARFLQATGSEGKTINKSEHLSALKRDLKGTRPYCVCPWCQGSGKKGCKGCSGTGWVTKVTWDNADDQTKKNLK